MCTITLQKYSSKSSIKNWPNQDLNSINSNLMERLRDEKYRSIKAPTQTHRTKQICTYCDLDCNIIRDALTSGKSTFYRFFNCFGWCSTQKPQKYLLKWIKLSSQIERSHTFLLNLFISTSHSSPSLTRPQPPREVIRRSKTWNSIDKAELSSSRWQELPPPTAKSSVCWTSE